MKVRNGFVSNSSSSSFVLVGKKVAISDLTNDLVASKKYMAKLDAYNDGQIFAILDGPKILDYFKMHSECVLDVYEVIDTSYEKDITLNTDEYHEELAIFGGEVDQWMPNESDADELYETLKHWL